MHDESAWGPWVAHCGTREPENRGEMQVEIPTGARYVIGAGERTVRVVTPDAGYQGPKYASSWIWLGDGPMIPVVRYRYRRPRALRELIDLAAAPPALEEAGHADAA